MGTRWLDDLKTAPEKLNTRRVELSHRARQRVHTFVGEGQEKLHGAHVATLQRVSGLLDKADDLPVVGRLWAPAARFAEDRLEQARKPSIEDYDELNAKTIIGLVDDLDRLELVKIREYEQANKDRVTVLRAVDKALDRLDTLPEPEAPARAATA